MTETPWVKWNVVCYQLGITRKHLDQLRYSGTIKPKVHYINVGRRTAMRPTYRYHLPNCIEHLKVPMEKR